MWSPSASLDRLRAKVVRIWTHHKNRLGCADLATKQTARELGASPMVVHRIRGRYGSVKAQLHYWFNAELAEAKHFGARLCAPAQRVAANFARFKLRSRRKYEVA